MGGDGPPNVQPARGGASGREGGSGRGPESAKGILSSAEGAIGEPSPFPWSNVGGRIVAVRFTRRGIRRGVGVVPQVGARPKAGGAGEDDGRLSAMVDSSPKERALQERDLV